MSDAFAIQNDLIQADDLSPVIFIFALDIPSGRSEKIW